ncbi:MAG TPA: serine/threonine-protein kinase [Polyangiaceae bacterium]|nr:serine/threonine-protein kinase [Polyangiaceae bacterium]
MTQPASQPRVARLLGRYAVYGEIAAGGMATVYIGRLRGPAGFARRVAVKSLHPQLAKDPDFLSMFLDEARLVGHIQHTNVVPVLDVIAVESELHLVMEYVEGEPLSRVVRALRSAGRKMPPPIAVAILIGVLDGLHAAHEARAEDGSLLSIVHRDVSPQNILVGVDGIAKILDFGIAKAVGRMQTTRGDQLKGKLSYMAPEQLSRDPLDRRADVYAAAIVLWELVTGERLFQADDEISTFKKAMEHRVPPASSTTAGVPAALDSVILRGLERDRRQRFSSAREMARALEATGLAATPREVGEFLCALCASSLAERAQRIEEHERQVVPEAATAGTSPVLAADARADAPTRLLSVQASRLSRWALAAALALPLLLLGGLLLLRPRPEPELPAARPQSPSAAKPLVPEPVPATAAPPADSVPLPAATETARPSRPAARAGARPNAASRKRDCAVPFTLDAHGVKVPKLECL